MESSFQSTVFFFCHGDLAALDMQDWPPHILQQFTDGVDAGEFQFKALDLGPSDS